MKIYTKTGDEGLTSLYTGERVPKDSPRVEAYGTIDELNSALGMARALCRRDDVRRAVFDIQKLLGTVMAEVASRGDKAALLGADHIAMLEKLIDGFDAALPPLTQFVVPGDTPAAAALDVARTTARRAERRLWGLAASEPLRRETPVILNRLSDLCFVLSRVESRESDKSADI